LEMEGEVAGEDGEKDVFLVGGEGVGAGEG